ncbi:19S proteasome regulatory subunit Rpn9 [Schizosaccharomyces osmophilus]|uniref:19S proteasome regulatory subunit Rpn9 n=1 Tax=Schizosaccharomyces osmophilus TaxID=2545709 RepID=A0AAF0AWQ9_9SCHI|nr:19S proteasome regulatory subunit Rpn9 [Schizosaccharomyces osmophilus]WBW73280.1 19S proteasome regulatory subunit Rpn9 [Schizosaccharomyces osmophilus]
MDTEMAVSMSNFLQDQAARAPEQFQEYYFVMEDLYERKLWKQLTDKLIQFFETPETIPLRLDLYTNFVSAFRSDINQLKAVYIALKAFESCSNEEAFRNLTQLIEGIDEEKFKDAYVYALVAIGRIKLVFNDLDAARDILIKADKVIERIDYVENIIHASYYSVSADYYKAKADYAQYYRHCLLYLSCVDLEQLSRMEMEERAVDLSVAAILGDIYNFGELLLHPVFQVLVGTQHEWLHDLVVAMNVGDLAKYERLMAHINKIPLLQSSVGLLGQKVRLMALIELVFQLPPNQRTLTFHTIAKATRIPSHEVELLIMRALSVGLITGLIDQVAQIVNISSVQSRILNHSQVASMETRLRDWNQNIHSLNNIVEASGKGVFV